MLLAIALYHPSVYWPVVGIIKGQAFYQGMPTEYWSKEIQRHSEQRRLAKAGLLPSGRGLFVVTDRLGYTSPVNLKNGPQVLWVDPSAIFVLIELLKDKDQGVTEKVISCLQVGPYPASEVGPLLLKGLQDELAVQARLRLIGTMAKIGRRPSCMGYDGRVDRRTVVDVLLKRKAELEEGGPCADRDEEVREIQFALEQ